MLKFELIQTDKHSTMDFPVALILCKTVGNYRKRDSVHIKIFE